MEYEKFITGWKDGEGCCADIALADAWKVANEIVHKKLFVEFNPDWYTIGFSMAYALNNENLREIAGGE